MRIDGLLRAFLTGLLFLMTGKLFAGALPEEGRTFGIVIGVADYSRLPKLQFADKDALEFYLYLRKTAPADAKRISVFLNKNATRNAIAEKFYGIVSETRPGDRVFIYFSGHGDIEQLYTANNFFLLLGNCPTKNYMASSNNLLDKNFFDYYIQPLIAKKVKIVFICDACHAGSLIGGEAGRKSNSEALLQSWRNEVKLLSCRPDQSSQESTKWGGGRSVFSYYLVLGMEGLADKDKDRQVSVSELAEYLDGHVVPAARAFNLAQEPEITGEKGFIISRTSALLLSEAQQQLVANSSSEEYNKLATSKGAKIQVGNNTYIFKGSSAGQYDEHLEAFNDNSGSITDSYWRSVYYTFHSKMEEGRYLKPDNNSALYYYRLFKGGAGAGGASGSGADGGAAATEEMRTSLLSALLDTYDTLLASYYRDDTLAFEKGLASYEIQNLSAALELAGDLPLVRDQIKAATLFLDAGRQTAAERSIALLLEATRTDSLTPALYGRLGDLYFSAGQFGRAADNYRIYLQLLPNEEHAHNKMGRALLALRQYDPARDEFKRALQLNPSFGPASDNLRLTENKGK